MEFLKLTTEKLSVEAITDLVVCSTCDAVSLFVGTIPNTEAKNVVNLENEACERMAIKALEKICSELRNQWPSVANIAIYHRLGSIPVKEASVVIAVSAPHRADATFATQWCIDAVQKSVPSWKKEIYSMSRENENKELLNFNPQKKRLFVLQEEPEVEGCNVPPHLVQIRAPYEEIERRMGKFEEGKREEINSSNIRDFCVNRGNKLDSCARVDAILVKRKDSKSHLQVNRVLNTYSRDQDNEHKKMKNIFKNGYEERLLNLESQLNIDAVVPGHVYKRLKIIEDRLLHLESISPEYIQFWDRNAITVKSPRKKQTFTIDEIDELIIDIRRKTIAT